MLGIVLFFTQCEKEAIEKGSVETYMELKSDDACSVTQTLWAGAGQNDTLKGTDVGSVTATVVGNTLVVEYAVEAPWYLTETHLWVGKNKYDVPRNAAPGRFPFKANLDFESGWSQVVNLASLGINPGDPIYVAAHGVVVNNEAGEPDYDALDLPIAIDYTWQYFPQLTNPRSYFEITVTSENWLAGLYEGWCADPAFPAGANPRSGVVFSSYDATIFDQFEKPENLPLINWIINYDFVGKPSVAGGNFTLGDVQRAMWVLLWIDPNLNPPGGVGPSSAARVAEILEMAMENGEDFMPGCGEYLVLFIDQDQDNRQNMFIKYPVPCVGGADETVWAYGEYTFNELNIARKWGWVFEVTCY